MNQFFYKALFRAFRTTKAFYWAVCGTRDVLPENIVFVVGCQRSGTSLVLTIFEWDRFTKVYRELDEVFSGETMRLQPLQNLHRIMGSCRHPAAITKPLLDSQFSDRLIAEFPQARLLWTFRRFEEAARSNLQHFGIRNGIDDIRPIALRDQSDWRAERVSEDIQSLVERHFSEGMNPHDAAALFWLSRNQLFFDLKLDESPNVTLCKYEDLAAQPRTVIRELYSALGRSDLPCELIYNEIHGGASRTAPRLDLAPEIRDRCEQLWAKLCLSYDSGPIASSLARR